MANTIQALVNNVRSSIQGLVDNITNSSQDEKGVPKAPSTNKEIGQVLSTVDASNWMKLSFPYTFSVIDVEGGEDSPFGDFELPLAPQSIRQTENFAVSIKPTQGGTTVSHSGNRYKQLNIKGTTGISPFRGAGGVQRSDGQAILQTTDLKYRSGYEVFLRLRNWFRTYYEYKRVEGRRASNLRLVFKNYKDGEFLIVELMKFDMNRQASKSFMYDYDLDFKVLAHLSFSNRQSEYLADTILDRAVELIDTARGVFLGSQDILRQVESVYDAIVLQNLRRSSLAVKAFRGIAPLAADIRSRSIKDTVSRSTVLAIALDIRERQDDNKVTGALDPRIANIDLPSDLEAAAATQGADLLLNFNEGLMALDSSIFPEETVNTISEEQESLGSLPRSFYEDTIKELKRIKSNAEDLFNLGSEEYDSIFDRTTTLEGSDPNRIVSQEEYAVLDAFNNAIIGMGMILASEDLFRSTYNEIIEDMVDRFDGNLSLQTTEAVEQITISAGNTLERLAQIHLRDSTRWGELAELNNLRAPYIVDDLSSTLENVLRPGDKLLIPVPAVNGFSQVPSVPEIKTTRGLSELEKSLGTDLRLSPDNDLVLTNTGDLEVVSGTGNMAQQVLLKLSFERNELMRHPNLGANISVGRKFPPLKDIQDGVVNTLLQDSRIDQVQDLSIVRDNSALFLTFNLKLKNIDIPIPVKIKIQ